ncbi:MAG TPA: SDR family NAD(P)-dependent oxidoreductase, partial [Flavitalea sp.]|nr:SDR family NAD(P)-dependent oxidoreductase [Flavitalea sp.]
MGRLQGKVALITGGSRGIGAGIVRKLAQEGASVAFTYVNATEKANSLQNELSAQGGNILSINADSSQTQEVEYAIQLVVKKFGRIDILVN